MSRLRKLNFARQVPIKLPAYVKVPCQVLSDVLEWGESRTLFKERLLNHFVGVEVEVENVPLRVPLLPNITGWESKKDGSLRNDGVEFVTSYGTTIHTLPMLLDYLSKFRDASHKEVVGSFTFGHRTSVHVHHNIRNRTEAEIKSLLMTYLLFEKALFNFAGKERMDNIFCVPLSYTLPIREHQILPALLHWCKYSALNFSRLSDLGTVEFRQLAGTADSERIMTWVLLGFLLLDYTKGKPPERIEKELFSLKTSSRYREFAEKVFGPLVKHLQISDREVDDGVSAAKQLCSIAA